MDPIVNKIKDGIHMDNTVLEQPEDTYRYARNFVIHQVANGMYKAVTLKGTELYFTMPANEKPMAFTAIRNRYFMIVLNSTAQIVKFYEVIDNSIAGVCTLDLLRQISNSYMNLSFDWPIRTIFGFYENDDVQRIYWTDYNSSPRVVNIVGMSEYSDTKFAKYLSFTPILENIYGQFIFDSINAGGNLLNGNYFIAWQYYTKDGYYSDWSPLSLPISVTPSNVGSTVDAYQDYEGAAPNINSSKNIKFRIKNIDTDYSSIRIAAFYSNDYNSAGPGIIFYDGDINASEMNFFLRGSENLGTLTLDELIEHTMVVEKCKSLAPIKLYNVAACLKERDELDFMPSHANNLLPVKVVTKINELLADTTGYPTHPFTAGQKSLFAVPKCESTIITAGTGYAGIWYKANEISNVAPFGGGADVVVQEGEFYRDMNGKFIVNTGKLTPTHKINKYDSEGVSLKGTVVTTQTAQPNQARVDKILVSGTWGHGTVTFNGLTKAITFSNDIKETVQTFVSNWAADYLAANVRITSEVYGGGQYTITGTSTVPGTDFSGPSVLTPTYGDLSGTVVNTVPFQAAAPQVDYIIITGTEGSANISIGSGTTYPILFENSIEYSIGQWMDQYSHISPNIVITTTGSPINQIVLTYLDGFHQQATISHNPAGTVDGAVTTVNARQLGTKQVCQIRFIDWAFGDINIWIGATARILHFNYNLTGSIVAFVSSYASTFLTNEGVDISLGLADGLNITAHTAGIANPAIHTDNYTAVPYNVTINQNYVANAVAVAREDNVELTGSGGIIRISYFGNNYDCPWHGSLSLTVTAFINKWFQFFQTNNMELFVSPVDVASLRIRSAIVTMDLPVFTSPPAPEGDLGGSQSSTALFEGNKRKVTITLTNTEGRARININSLFKLIYYSGSREDTALAFKNAYEAYFLTGDVTLTNSGDDLIFESTTNGLDFFVDPTIDNDHVDILTGLAYTYVPNTVASPRIDKITLAGVKGMADVKVNGVTRIATFTTSLTATAAQFVTDFAGEYDTNGSITLTSVGEELFFTGKTSGVNFDGSSYIINKNDEGNVEEIPYEGEYMDYKGPTAASKLRGYPSDEYIRLGILFFDLMGKPFYVRWLDNTADGGHGDVFIPRRQHIAVRSNELLSNYDYHSFAEGDEYNQTNSRNVFLNISDLDITPIKDLISGFMIVRAPIVHRNLAYGNLSFISATDNDLYLNPGYFNYNSDSSKYPGIYAFICPEDLFDFKNFVITKGDKLKNIGYLSPERKAFSLGTGFTGLGKRDTAYWSPGGSPPYIYENLYSKFYLPYEDQLADLNGKDEIMHEILYSLKYNVGDGSKDAITGVIVDPRNVSKLFHDRTRDIIGAGDVPFSSNPGKMNIVVLDIDESFEGYLGVKGMFNRNSNDPIMLMCSIYRENNDPYGGYGDASLANTLYMSTGHYQDINSSVLADVKKTIDGVDKYIFNNIEIYGGDTFVCLFDHKRNLLNENDGNGQSRYGYSTIFPVETRMNLTLREGNHIAKNHSYSAVDPLGIRRKVDFMKLEDYNYNDGYSSDNLNALYHALPFGFINNSKFEARMRYTQPKIPGEKIDKFRIFPPLNKIDLSINFGIINNIRENYSNLLYWQEDQIGYIPINERQLASNAFGSAVQLGVGGVFERYDEIVTRLGNSHQFGLIDSPVGYHWYDAKRKMYLSVYKDMKLSQDSIISGLNTFFDGIPDMIYNSGQSVPDKSLDSLKYDNPGKDYGICGGFDPKNKIVFTTIFKPDNTIETIGISTLTNKFIGFFDYKSRFYFGMKNGLYSFRNNYTELHRHNTGDFLTFHGELAEGHIQLVIKESSNLDKIFDTFDFIGNKNFFNKIRYQNSDQDIEEIIDPSDVEKYRYRNKRWYGTVPIIERARIMDSHLLVTFKVTIAEEVEFYQVTFNTRRMI